MKKQTTEQLLREIETLKLRVGELEQINHKAFSQFLLDTAMDGYVVVDTKGNIVEINQAYCELLGYRREELLDMNIRQLSANKSAEDIDQQIKDLLRKGKDRFETLQKHKDGRILELEASLRKLNLGDRNLIVVFMRDITERTKALEALKESEFLLRESQKVARLGSYTLEFSTGLWFSSEILDEIFGIDKSFRTDVPGWLQIIHPDDRAMMQEYFETLVAKKRKVFDKEYRIHRIEDKQERWVHGLGALEYLKDGTPQKMIGTIQDITERKKVEGELLESELRFRTIIEQAADALFIIDFEGRILEVNNRACASLGYTREELLSMNIGEIDMEYDDRRNDPENTIMANLQVGNSFQIENTHRRKDGTTYPSEASLCVIELNQKKVILGFVRDISKRKMAEEGLLKMNKAIDNSSEVIFLTDLDGIITYMNPEFTKMYGYTAEEVIGKVTPRILNSGLAGKNEFQKMWQILLGKQSIPASRYVNKDKNGKYIDVEGSADPILDEHNQVIGFLGIQRDITKRMRDEQIQSVLYQISNAVNTSDNLNHLIAFIQKELGKVIDTSHFYIALYEEESDILSFPSFKEDPNEEKFIYAGNTLFNYIVKTQAPRLFNKSEIENLVQSGSLELLVEDVEMWLGVPLKLKGKVTGVLAVQSHSRDVKFDEADMKMLEFVSDQISLSIYRKKAELDLLSALDKATESDRLKSAFLASMSHELRTPLNAIIGFSDLYVRDLSAEEMINYAKIINSSGHQLLSIVEDLFDIALIEAGEVKLRKRKEDLYPIMLYIQEVIEVEKQKAKRGNLDLKLTIAPEDRGVIIHTDSVKLKQILINLLKNAIKFTRQGHVHFGYAVKKDERQGFIEFFVEDTGKGIPENMGDLIFEMFRQVEDSNSKNVGGTGIGLSIAKKMTELLGGRIWYESREGVGSVFYFTLPLQEPVADDLIPGKGQENMQANWRQKGKLVLIVEDDEASMKFLKVLLEKQWISTLWANSGKEAIKSCEEHPDIDLVLMDINMAEMDGYEATREIKKLYPGLPIIAQTAYAVDGDHEKALQNGCDDYISKPIKKEELLSKMEVHLGRMA